MTALTLVLHLEELILISLNLQTLLSWGTDTYSQGMGYICMNLQWKITHCTLKSIKLTKERWFARPLTYFMLLRMILS